jgi:tetratricopeptide (TPR) repeat protein
MRVVDRHSSRVQGEQIMKRWIVTASVMAVLAGCQQPEMRRSKQEAHLHWQNTRGRVAYSLAAEQFKSGQVDKAYAQVQEALSLSPDDGEARLLLGKILIEQGRYAQAIPELQTACSRLPKSSEAPFMLGVTQERAGRMDDSLNSYQKALDAEPGNLSAVMSGAEVLVAMGRSGEAQAIVESYLGAAGDEPGMFELAGRLARMAEDPARAAEYYGQALDLDPANARYREALAEALYLCKQYREAVDTLRTLLQAPKYAAPAWVHTMLGDCCLALDQPREARAAYAAAKDLAPADSRAWVNLAKVSLALSEAPRAITSAREALRLDSRSLDAYLVLGCALLKDGQAPKAVQVLAPAAEKFPQHVVLRCLLGRAYAGAGDAARAGECYADALRLAPDDPLPKALLAAAAE